MKKLKLSDLNPGNAEVLSREQLKKVLGGFESGGSGDTCYQGCNCGEGWPSYGTWTSDPCSQDSDCKEDFTCGDGCSPYAKCG